MRGYGEIRRKTQRPLAEFIAGKNTKIASSKFINVYAINNYTL